MKTFAESREVLIKRYAVNENPAAMNLHENIIRYLLIIPLIININCPALTNDYFDQITNELNKNPN